MCCIVYRPMKRQTLLLSAFILLALNTEPLALLGSSCSILQYYPSCTQHRASGPSRCDCRCKACTYLQSLRFTGYEPCALALPTHRSYFEGAVDVFAEGSVGIGASCVHFSFLIHNSCLQSSELVSIDCSPQAAPPRT